MVGIICGIICGNSGIICGNACIICGNAGIILYWYYILSRNCSILRL